MVSSCSHPALAAVVERPSAVCVCVCLFVWRAVLHVFLCACVSMYVLWVVWTRNPPPSAVNGEGPSAVVGTGESPFSSFTSRCFVHCATLPAYPPRAHTHTLTAPSRSAIAGGGGPRDY